MHKYIEETFTFFLENLVFKKVYSSYGKFDHEKFTFNELGREKRFKI